MPLVYATQVTGNRNGGKVGRGMKNGGSIIVKDENNFFYDWEIGI